MISQKIKKWIFAVFVLGLLFGSFLFVSAQNQQIEIDFFYSKTCVYCAKEDKFLDGLEIKYPEIKVNRFEVSKKENAELLMAFYKDYEVNKKVHGLVPMTFIGDRYFPGFKEETGIEIENCIKDNVINGSCESIEGPQTPFIGKIDITKYSLSALAVVLGFLDGFNVCSLGALVLILGLVLALRSRKKILIFGGIFILTTAVVYGGLIALWYQIFSFFIPYLKIMETLIGFLAIGGGIYFLKEFLRFRKQGPTCEPGTGKKIMSKFSSKIQAYLQKSNNIFLVMGAVFLFAAAITIVEFPCSAVVPVAFAGVLAESSLSPLLYLLYISIFIIFYMFDEIIVFLVALTTMKLWLSSNKIILWITLIEAIVLFGLGGYYLFGFNIL